MEYHLVWVILNAERDTKVFCVTNARKIITSTLMGHVLNVMIYLPTIKTLLLT